MNEELQQRSLQAMDQLLAFVESTGDFVGQQAPLVAQEIIEYRRFFDIWIIVLMVILVIGGLFLRKKILSSIDARFEEAASRMNTANLHEGWRMEILAGEHSFNRQLVEATYYALNIIAFVVNCIYSVDLIKVSVAPRLVIIETIRSMLQ